MTSYIRKLTDGKIYLTRGGYFARVISEASNNYANTAHYHVVVKNNIKMIHVMKRTNRILDGLWSCDSLKIPDMKDIVWEIKALAIIVDDQYVQYRNW